MSAYERGSLTIEAYLVRLLAAACRQNGGELRLKGELIDTVGEATALLKSWDTAKQELVLSVSMGTFGEVFRVIPEKQVGGQTVIRPNVEREETQPPANGGARTGSTLLDEDHLKTLETRLLKRRIAAMIRDERTKSAQTGG